ncbi:hypothetical protein Tco_0249606, partial [Tanacetum coccineum]
MGNVTVEGMLIPDAFITNEIRATKEYKEYEQVFFGVDVPIIQPQPVVSTQGTHRNTPSALRSPTITTDIALKKKRKLARETSSPRKSLNITIRQKKARTTPILLLGDDQEKDDMAEATLLEEEIEKMFEGKDDKESYASEFADSMFHDDDDDSGNKIELGSHKEHPENFDDDEDE